MPPAPDPAPQPAAEPPTGAAPHTEPARPRVLVLLAHPELAHSRVNRAIARRLASLPGVALRDLYALYPDYHLDVAAEQAALAEAGLVVWLHPLHWYGATPLLKLWMDEVLAFGWAYGPGGQALANKDLWAVVSTGGSDHSYRPDGHNRYFFDAFWPPYEQTAALTGMRWLPPLVLHSAHQATDAAIAAHAELVAQRLAGWPDAAAWPELAEVLDCAQCEAPVGDRPTYPSDEGPT